MAETIIERCGVVPAVIEHGFTAAYPPGGGKQQIGVVSQLEGVSDIVHLYPHSVLSGVSHELSAIRFPWRFGDYAARIC